MCLIESNTFWLKEKRSQPMFIRLKMKRVKYWHSQSWAGYGSTGLCHPGCSQRIPLDESEHSQHWCPHLHTEILQEIFVSLANQDFHEGDCGCGSLSQILKLFAGLIKFFNILQTWHHIFEGTALIKHPKSVPFSYPVYRNDWSNFAVKRQQESEQ